MSIDSFVCFRCIITRIHLWQLPEESAPVVAPHNRDDRRDGAPILSLNSTRVIPVSRFDPCRCTRWSSREPKTRIGGPAEERNRTSVRKLFQRIISGFWERKGEKSETIRRVQKKKKKGQIDGERSTSTCEQLASGEICCKYGSFDLFLSSEKEQLRLIERTYYTEKKRLQQLFCK